MIIASGITIGESTKYFTASEFAETVVHEVLHQGGVDYPTEDGASEDVRLDKNPIPAVPNSYKSN